MFSIRLVFFVFFLVISVKSFINHLNPESTFNEEQFLMRDVKSDQHIDQEGSGEDNEDVLINENSTTTSISESTTTTTVTKITTAAPKPINCYDISKRCSKVKPLCTRNEYKTIMMRQCAKTCGFCPQFVRLPQTSRCRDSFQRYKSKNIAIRKCF
ncbi:ShKT domain-containing protein [Caenorhabditis elegans]|uniref:ShKT domain-containing protein n=1 Tax=Caenorhabditis elegans TaxID=6239 RepID=Q7YWZ4_CAEEL|nr:ShKT domain-containing protein [Caenorhabditis elegans]CAE17855.1 ShKT domain-containing protein [Caenorhabditis elegans]|eukprot:NP_001254150.1 Uncharacterized protein CELE_M05D6.8 [Caenorhabditis elegans]